MLNSSVEKENDERKRISEMLVTSANYVLNETDENEIGDYMV